MTGASYPVDFESWPEEERNQFFADKARECRAEKANGVASIPTVDAIDDPRDDWDRAPPPESAAVYGHCARDEAPGYDDKRAPAPVTLKVFSAATLKDREVAPRRWIVPNYIPDGTPTLLSGDGGTGKSWITLQLIVARALVGDWLGLLPEPGSSLFLSAEDDEAEMHRRLNSILRFYAKQKPATWDDLKDVHLVDLVGENSILGLLSRGIIEPAPIYKALDTYIGDFKPGLVALDVLSALFGGEERSRTQTRQFANLLHRLTRRHGCAVLLLAHPSLTGMNTGTGSSGSTDWNNAFRSRLYFKTPKTEQGTEINKNLRTFEGKKNNRGELGAPIDVEFKNGLFVPVNIPGGLDKLAADAKINETFTALLKRFNAQGRNASDTKGTSYAPALFAKEPEGQAFHPKELEAGMVRLFKAGKIQRVNNGCKSKPSWTLVPTETLALENE